MKNYTKREAIAIMTAAAERYRDHLCGRKFLLAYSEDGGICTVRLGFQAHNFKHFTGVLTNDTAKQFYEKALDHQLAESDFDFDRYGNAQRKLAVLPMLHTLFSGPVLYGRFSRTGICIEADYFVGSVPKRLAVAFRSKKSFDFPVSLYCEDVRSVTEPSFKIIAVWRMEADSDKFTDCIYSADGVDAGEVFRKAEAT